MIQQLSGWLKSVILIILIATFVDLLLPNRQMQRYVKVVVSLIILLTILTPVITLLKSDFSVEQQLSKLQAAWHDDASPDNGNSLNRILDRAKKLQNSDIRSYSGIVQSEVENMVVKEVEQKTGAKVDNVIAALDVQQGDPKLTGLTVWLEPSSQAGSEQNKGRSAPAEKAGGTVAPVTINPVSVPDIKPLAGNEEGDGTMAKRASGVSNRSSGTAPPAGAAPDTNELRKKVLLDLEQRWQLRADQIRIILVGAGKGQAGSPAVSER